MRMKVLIGLGMSAAVAASSCGGGGGGPSAPPFESASLCAAVWEPVTPAAPFDVTSSLGYRDGVIYYTTFSPSSVMALPTAGGPATPIASLPTYGSELWVDGDQLIVSSGNYGTQFFSVPFAGGTPSLIVDGASGRSDPGSALVYALTPTDFHWLEFPSTVGGPTTAWRVSRTGGSPTLVGSASATLPNGPVTAFDRMAVSADAVVMAAVLGVAAALPLDGSPARVLATSDDLTRGSGNYAGIDAAGVYWTAPRAGVPLIEDKSSVMLAPADGGPLRVFWDGLPAHAGVWSMWPDGNGGWVIVSLEVFDDLKQRMVIWLMDASGQAKRLGCSPPAETSLPYISVRPAVAPDAIYLEDSGSKFQIVRVAR